MTNADIAELVERNKQVPSPIPSDDWTNTILRQHAAKHTAHPVFSDLGGDKSALPNVVVGTSPSKCLHWR